MTPRIAGRGHSFKGAGLYYFHDKEAPTSERVAWTHTHNVPTDNPEKAVRWMAWTAINAGQLKAQNGTPATGRQATNGVVYTYSLAWHPQEKPEQKSMLKAALETLGALGLKEHEAVFVAHNDTKHSHVHVIANLVHPETGKTANVYRDRLTLSKWAESYEKEHGIYCPQRIKNNEERNQGKYVKHREEKHDRAQQIEQLYSQSRSGKVFSDELQKAGYTLAKGNRRAFVLVDETGKIYSLSRQLKGQRAKDISAKLADIDAKNLQEAKKVSDERKHFYRDDYETERQKKIADAAVKVAQQRESQKQKDSGEKQARKPEEQAEPNRYKSYADEISPQFEKERAEQLKRLKNEVKLNEFYNRKELVLKLSRAKAELARSQGLRGKLTGRKNELEKEIEALTKTLENTDKRITEQRATFEKSIEKNSVNLPSPENQNEQQVSADLVKLRAVQAWKKRAQERDAQKGKHLRGMEPD